MGSRETPTAVLGRRAELDRIGRFLDGTDAAALVLAGDAGLGKTTLWEAGVAAARERGRRVLSARASEAETRLSFVTLADLLDDVHPRALLALPAPQRRALAVAVLEDEPDAAPLEPRAVALGLLGALRELAANEPLLVAIDDVQWVDEASARALSFAARRLTGADVLFLASERVGAGAAHAVELPAPRRVDLGALSGPDIRRLLADRLELTVPQRLMDDVMTASGGNPLFALEVGRTLVERGIPWIGERLAVPAAVDELVRERVSGLPFPVQALVLAAALSRLSRADLTQLADPEIVEEAIEGGALVVDRDRVRLGHPLLGAAALARASAADQRAMHARLAVVAGDPTRRALHRARASVEPDAVLAAELAAAAERALVRGAAQDAAELSGHALRLTPPESPERPERVLSLGDHLLHAGHDREMTELIEAELPSLPRGQARVRAHLLLNEGLSMIVMEEWHRRLRLAYEEADGDPVIEAPIVAQQAHTLAVGLVRDLPEAERLAREAAAVAARTEPDAHRFVLTAYAWVRALRGHDVDDLAARYDAVTGAAPKIYRSVEQVLAVQMSWRGEIGRARELLTRLRQQAEDAGDPWSSATTRLHLCENEARAGDWPALEELLVGWGLYEDEEITRTLRQRLRALMAAGRGDPEEAERWIAATIATTEETGVVWDRLEAERARGVAALAAGDPAAGADALRGVWEHLSREGVEEPGAIPVAPDLVEALVQLEQPDEARAVTEWLHERAEEQDHPWGRLGVRRCRALLDERESDDLVEVAAGYEALGLRFDAARTLLALGRIERRRRRWAAARDALGRAAAAFDAIAAPGWVAQVRGELERVGGRRPRTDPGELTPAERRVVELAADGQSNKQIARALVVSMSTVEGHLTRAYAKLGVRSRAELVRRLSEPSS